MSHKVEEARTIGVVRFGMVFCAGLALLLAVFPRPAIAQTPVDADFQRYCREKFDNSAYRRQIQSWGVDHYCMQGPTPQNIDLGEACRLTTGSPKFRKVGLRVLCTGSAEPATRAEAGPPDFRRYCNDRFPNSAYEKRAEGQGIVHYCRRPGATGGFTLQNIDLNEACRLTRGLPEHELLADGVWCVEAHEAAVSDQPAGIDESTAHGKWSAIPVAPTEVDADIALYCRTKHPNSTPLRVGVTYYCKEPSDFQDATRHTIDLAELCRMTAGSSKFRRWGSRIICAASSGEDLSQEQRRDPVPDEDSRPEPEPDPGAPPSRAAEVLPDNSQVQHTTALSCRALGGRWHGGTIPMVDDILKGWTRRVGDRSAGCVNLAGRADECRRQVRTEEAVAAYFETMLIWQCHATAVSNAESMLIDDVRTARKEGCAIQKSLEELQEVIDEEAATMQVAPHGMTLDRMGLDDLCAVGTISLVREDGTEVEAGQDVPLLVPVEMRVTFDRDMKRPRREVEVVTDQGRFRVTAIRKGPRLYTGERPIVFEPPPSVQP